MTRKYELRKRADRVADTRRRIIEATVELHRTAGPARTGVSEIARRTGLRRVTVYDHFPDDVSLIVACSSHWRSLHPGPDPAAWAGIEPPAARLRSAVLAVYRWYRETEPMTANVLRDAELVPALRDVLNDGLFVWLAAVRTTLEAPFTTPVGVPERVRAAIRLAVDFHAWRALAPLGDSEAAELAARLVEAAAASGEAAVPPEGSPRSADGSRTVQERDDHCGRRAAAPRASRPPSPMTVVTLATSSMLGTATDAGGRESAIRRRERKRPAGEEGTDYRRLGRTATTGRVVLGDARESGNAYETAALPLSYFGAVRRSAPPQTHDRRQTVMSARVVDSEGDAVIRGDGVNGIVRTPAGRLR